MSLAPGTRLGPYEITAQVGVGGMGEVYRAIDTNLKRAVAIKVLPAAVASDAERLARFQREAEVLASLNHPNIAQVHGLEKSDGTTALVMELVEGPTLADRIAEGPIPIDDSLLIAKQIAEALEAAHERGIVHRDLKPANIKMRADGTVKVLDFGLAKALDATGTNPRVTQSPTLMSPAVTGVGVILGTAAYMSPEQAKGREIDRRADIWAFGCVVYEMLTGERAFLGEDVSETIASILRGEPDWNAIPPATPRPLTRLLRRCLQRDANQRLHDIADARIEINELLSGTTDFVAPPASAKPSGSRTTLAIAVLAVIVVTAGVVWYAASIGSRPPAPAVKRFTVALPDGQGYTNTGRHVLALSPTGRHLVFTAGGRLHLRALDSLDTIPIPGTDGTSDGSARSPFFSATGEWLGFWQGGVLKKMPVSGGAAARITDTGNMFGAYWHEDDTIFFAMGGDGVLRVPASGGSAEQIVTLQAGELAQGPQLLPGGEWLLFTLRPQGTSAWDDARVVAQSLRTGERRVLIEGGRDGRYVVTGHLLHHRGGTVFATAFDGGSVRTIGTGVPVLQNIAGGDASGVAQFAVSPDGSLAYVRNQALVGRGTPVWVSADGRNDEPLTPAPLDSVEQPRLSPDGRRMAILVDGNIWVYDLGGRPPIKLTFEGGRHSPQWTPDGKQLVSEGATPSALRSIAADGSGTLSPPLTPVGHYHPHGFTPDGGELVVVRVDSGANPGTGIERVTVGSELTPQPVVQTSAAEGFFGAALSPDGKFLAYVSNATGENEIWVQPYPGPGAATRVSANGGIEPVWARNGRELYYLENTLLMRVEVDTRSSFEFKPPTRLFDANAYALAQQAPSYDVGLDGRFLMIKAEQRATIAPMVVVLNWFEELKRLVPTK